MQIYLQRMFRRGGGWVMVCVCVCEPPVPKGPLLLLLLLFFWVFVPFWSQPAPANRPPLLVPCGGDAGSDEQPRLGKASAR